MNRRRFLKYAGGTAAAIGASALGLDYLLTLKNLNQAGAPTTVTVAAPSIENIQWTPTRVQNSKVYDGRVTFDVKNINRLSTDVKLDFQPFTPEQYPKAAFPAEEPRTYSLKPASTEPETNTMSFSQDITNLKGGKQYRALATVKDKSGKETVDYVDTPYIRELERLDVKDVTVGVQYGTWWTYGAWQRPFTVTPLLGSYTSSDPFVINRHIDMLTGFGGKAFLSFLDDAETDLNTSLLFDSPLIDDVSIGLVYDVPYRLLGKDHGEVNLNDASTKNKFKADLKYLAQKYFARKNYFRIKGMPTVYLYHAGESFSGNVTSRIKEVKDSVRKETGFDMFLIGETVMFDSPSYTLVKPYDAVTRFGTFYNKDPSSEYPGGINNNEDNLRRLYQRWSSYAHQLGVHFIPTAMPGFISIRPSEKNNPVLPKSTKRFADQLKIGIDFLDDDIRCLFVTTWNDYAENTNIEPTVQEGYSYLQTFRNTLVRI